MLTIVLLATIGQVYECDYFFMMSQENWVIDNLPKGPIGYTKYLPAALAAQVDLWHDECWRCRRKANEVIVSDTANLRWMFWTIRSTSLQVELHSEAILRGFATCRWCRGGGFCEQFMPDPEYPSCKMCYASFTLHDESLDKTCRMCDGRGFFENWPGCPWQLRHKDFQ